MSLGQTLYQQLADQSLITPYVENAFAADAWPEKIIIPMRSKRPPINDWFYPSTHALPGARWIYYQLHPEHQQNLEPRKESTPDKLRMLLGVFLHSVIQEKLKTTGLVSDEHIEVPLRDEEIHAKGRADLIFPNHPLKKKDIVIDIKTTRKENFDRLFKPSLSYKLQLLCYMKWYGELTGKCIDEGIILLVEAADPFRMKEFRVKMDEVALDELYRKWNYVRDCLSIGVPPEEKCCEFGSEKMNKCNARNICIQSYNDFGHPNGH